MPPELSLPGGCATISRQRVLVLVPASRWPKKGYWVEIETRLIEYKIDREPGFDEASHLSLQVEDQKNRLLISDLRIARHESNNLQERSRTIFLPMPFEHDWMNSRNRTIVRSGYFLWPSLLKQTPSRQLSTFRMVDLSRVDPNRREFSSRLRSLVHPYPGIRFRPLHDALEGQYSVQNSSSSPWCPWTLSKLGIENEMIGRKLRCRTSVRNNAPATGIDPVQSTSSKGHPAHPREKVNVCGRAKTIVEGAERLFFHRYILEGASFTRNWNLVCVSFDPTIAFPGMVGLLREDRKCDILYRPLFKYAAGNVQALQLLKTIVLVATHLTQAASSKLSRMLQKPVLQKSFQIELGISNIRKR